MRKTLLPDLQIDRTGKTAAHSSRRWLMIGFVFLATVINYLDRQTLSVLAPTLSREFHMSNADYGRVTAAFMLSYTVMNGVSGPLIDRLGTKIGYSICMFWWSAASILHSFARSAFGFGACRFLLGMGEAGNWPAGVRVVSEWFPQEERALAGGIFNSGSAIGALVAPPLIAWLVIKSSWHSAFILIGCSGFLWLIFWWKFYRAPVTPKKEINVPTIPVRELLKTRFVRAFMLSKIFMDPVWYFYTFWIAKYLTSVHHFDIKKVGFTAWIPFLTADIGNLAGGWCTAQLIRHGTPIPRARRISVTIFALLMTSAIPAAFIHNVWVVIALFSMATFGYTGYTANTLAFPADVFPKSTVASIWGLASMGAGFGGMIFGWLSGLAVDNYSYLPVLIAYGTFPVIALSIILFGLGPLNRNSS